MYSSCPPPQEGFIPWAWYAGEPTVTMIWENAYPLGIGSLVIHVLLLNHTKWIWDPGYYWGPGSAATLPQGQLRPYPCQGSAATLPTRILWKGQRFLPLPRVSCDPTWPQCKESYRFLQCFEVIQVQVQHSFYQLFPPFWQHMLSMIDFSPLLATHAFNDSGSRTTFLCDPTWQHSFYHISSPLGNPCFQWFKFKYNIPFINFFPPPLGNPCFATLPDNIPFIKFSPPLTTHAFNDSSSSTTSLLSIFSPPPWQPMLCDPTWQHSFYQIFPPPWQPMLSMIRVQVQHSFYQFFPPPPWQPMLCDPTWQHSPPLGNPCFQWFKFKYNIPFIKNFPPPWQPMLCDPTWQHSFYQISPPPLGNPCFQWFRFQYNIPFIKFSPPPLGNPCFATLPDNIPFIKFSPPLATHAFNDSSSSTTFLFIIFPPPPLATHALRPYLTTFLLSNFPPLGNPCFQWFKFKYNIPFINFFPPPPWQPMLCDPTWQHSFYQIFHPLGNPFFQWFKFKYNIPFMKKFPPPWQRTARSLSTPRKTPGILFGDPTQLFYQSTMPNKDRAPQHTVQPHIASKYANAPLRHAVNEPPETSQHHAKTSSHTLLRPYPTTFSNQQGRTEVGSNNTPYSHT